MWHEEGAKAERVVVGCMLKEAIYMRELNDVEIQSTSGGIPLLAPLCWGMVMDSGFIGAMTGAYATGFWLGRAFRTPVEDQGYVISPQLQIIMESGMGA